MSNGNIREGDGTPLQYSCLENPMGGGAWWAAVHGVAKSQTRLSDFTFTFHFRALEKEMATHSSVLAWRIPGTGESGGLSSMGSHRVGHDWSDLAAAAAAMVTCHAFENIYFRKKANMNMKLLVILKDKPMVILIGCCCCCWVASVMSDSMWPHGWQPTRLLCPQDSLG